MATNANPNYRVEHVATVPRGWRVRTKMQSTHMLRIAFPPGARRKGSGKVVEILHPVFENPCSMQQKRATRERAARIRAARIGENPAHSGEGTYRFLGKRFKAKTVQKARRRAFRFMELTGKRASRKKSNPDVTDQAAALYETFHGKSPKEIVEIQESDAQRKTYTALGDLVELQIDAADGLVSIGFSGTDGVKVASAPGGRQIYFLGGNQNLDSQLGRFGSDVGKDFVLLGTARQITYRARKSMNDFTLVDYYHNLGEETGEPPVAFYDRMKRRIFLAGGRYRVEAAGIID